MCTHDWLKQHQDDFKAIYAHAQDQLAVAADRQNQVTSPVSQPLAPGTLVYKVQRALDQDGRVHTICPLNGIGPEKNVNRAELRVISANVQVDPTLTSRTLRVPVDPQDQEEAKRGTQLTEKSDEEGIMVMEPVMGLQNGGETSSMNSPCAPPLSEPVAITPNRTTDHIQVEVQDTASVENTQSPSPKFNVVVRLSARATAGQYSNPFHLPRAISVNVGYTNLIDASMHVTFRPWI